MSVGSDPVVRLEAQGSLFKASVRGGDQRGGGLRGRVRGFSAAARKRLLETLARLRQDAGVLHITLTMAQVVSPAEMKRNLQVFWKRVEREYPRAAAVWRLAFESSGEREYHPHLHLAVYGVGFIPFEWLDQAWREVCGEAGGYVWVERWTTRRAAAYLARYIGREEEGRSLDYLTYLTGEDWTGRLWGVLNRDGLPWAVRQVVDMTLGRWFWDVKRAARRVWRGVSRYRLAGFTLFRDVSARWLDLAWFYAVA